MSNKKQAYVEWIKASIDRKGVIGASVVVPGKTHIISKEDRAKLHRHREARDRLLKASRGL